MIEPMSAEQYYKSDEYAKLFTIPLNADREQPDYVYFFAESYAHYLAKWAPIAASAARLAKNTPRKSNGYGLPCANCKTYYAANSPACPVCKSTVRISATAESVNVKLGSRG